MKPSIKRTSKEANKNRRLMTTPRIIMLGFLIGALLGSFLLCLPVSLKQGQSIEYLDALFLAVSSICVTGLSTVNVGMMFSGFGQVVLLLLIQVGGLGVVTFTTIMLVLFHKRLDLSQRLLIQSAYNLDSLTDLVKLTFRILRISLIIEGIGAVLYGFVFIPDYGPVGIWYSVFHSVSAFCNAGIDLLGGSSFTAYRDDVLLNVVTMALIIAGGLGFPVYWEIGREFKEMRYKMTIKKKVNFHARLAIWSTAVLVLAGAVFTLIFEYNNPLTLGELSFPKKCLASMFQSVTLRTAGFATIDQGNFRSVSCVIYLVLMFIGGSPAGTAGGIKTVTFVVLAACVISGIQGKKEVTLMKRKISNNLIRRCVPIIIFSFMVLVLLLIALLAFQNFDFLDAVYEMTSAISTVGLSRGVTGELNTAGKLIVVLAMYLGRIGPITLAFAFNKDSGTPTKSFPEGKVILG